MLRTIQISTSGLVAQRQRMNTIAGNIANAHTTRDADGNVAPFQRRLIAFSAEDSRPNSQGRGVGVNYRIEVDTAAAPRKAYEPGHPDADENGYVSYPNIDLMKEFVNAMEATRAYQANIAAVETTKQMSQLGLRILA